MSVKCTGLLEGLRVQTNLETSSSSSINPFPLDCRRWTQVAFLLVMMYAGMCALVNELRGSPLYLCLSSQDVILDCDCYHGFCVMFEGCVETQDCFNVNFSVGWVSLGFYESLLNSVNERVSNVGVYRAVEQEVVYCLVFCSTST